MSDSLEQARFYLDELDKEENRRRLSSIGIEYEEIKVIVLIGKDEFPLDIEEYVRSRYGSRIQLLSFTDIFERAMKENNELIKKFSEIVRFRQTCEEGEN